jgi:hypothetical protein
MATKAVYRQPTGILPFFSPPKHPKLLKRLNWVLGCANVSAFTFQAFEDWRTKKFRAFVRVRTVREYKWVTEIPGPGTIWELVPSLLKPLLGEAYFVWHDVGFGTKTVRAYGYPRDENVYTLVEEPIEHCYYLGQYPLLWDTWWHTITSPAHGEVSRSYPPSMGEGALFPLGWISGDPIPAGIIDTTGAGFPRGWKPGDPNPPNINYDPKAYFPRHFYLPGERFVPFSGPVVPSGWEATMLGYVTMDSVADIDSQINGLLEGIEGDKLLAKTELGKDFKVWIEKRPHLTLEEIDDIYGTISALERKKDFEGYGPKTETGMALATWSKENIGVTDEDLKFFWGDHEYKTYLITKEWDRLLKNRLDNCLARNYPIEIKQRTIKTPQGPRDWPGIPMKDLELPIPPPPEPEEPGAKFPKRHLTVWFGMLPTLPNKPEGLMCRVIIY